MEAANGVRTCSRECCNDLMGDKAMSAMGEHHEQLERELVNVGIASEIVRTGTGHMRIRWKHNGKPRSILTSWTPSDHRSTLNARARIRKLLRDDGLLGKPKEQPSKLVKALTVPVVQEPNHLRIERMEQDVGALLDIVGDLIARLAKAGIAMEEEPIKPPPPVEQKQRKPRGWRHDF